MNPASPLFVGDLVFFEGNVAPHMLIRQRINDARDNFALRSLSPTALEDCEPLTDLFRRFHPNNHPSICLQTIEDNAELGKIVHIVLNPDWSLLKE